MTKLRIVLIGALVLCALALITSQHRARRLFVDLDRAQARERALDVQWDQLQVEQREHSRSALVDAKARAQLSMKGAEPSRTLHLNLGDEARVVDRATGGTR